MLEIEYITKKVRDENEIINLKILRKISPQSIPFTKDINTTSYFIEKCQTIDETDFSPDNFSSIYNFLDENLYRQLERKYSEGIYKFFYVRHSYKRLFSGSSYVPYLIKELEHAIQRLKIYNNRTVCALLDENRSRAGSLQKWHPVNGFNLLHGDLHIGNMVKKNGNYLLIDYEYLRYGAKELEIANFILSCLMFYGMKNDHSNLSRITEEYLKKSKKIEYFDHNFFHFSLFLSLTLWYITALVKKNNKEIEVISKILALL